MLKSIWIGILMIGNKIWQGIKFVMPYVIKVLEWIWIKIKIVFKFIVDFIQAGIIGITNKNKVVSPNARYGYKPDLPDQRDYIFSDMLKKQVTLPSSIDLRAICSPIEDQGQLGSCTANGLVGALEFIENKDKDKFIDLSRLFLYYNERVIEGTTKSDSGAYIRDGIKALAQYGVCSEKDWPYNISQFTKKPSTTCYSEALQHTITTYARVLTLNDMKTALASGYPFVFGITVYSSFESANATKTGNIPLPKKNESVLGGHCMLCVGYDDSKQVFIFRNSWGTSWGNKGYGTIPYVYLSNTQLCSDCWVITKEKNF